MRGRARLRVQGERRDAFFTTVNETLSDCALVRSVQTRPTTGSVLVRHDGELEEVLAYAAEKGLFTVSEPPAPLEHVFAEINQRIDELDEELRERTEGRWDVSTMAFYSLVGTSLYQLARGHFLPHGGTLAIHALVLLRGAYAPRRSTDSSGGPGA